MRHLALSSPREACPDDDDDLRRCYLAALDALARTRDRAERAERRLRSRAAELAWPAVLGGLAGGVATVLALRLAGF
jgi:hypothetical protein